MNKQLFRLAGAILTFEALYLIIVSFPVLSQTFSPSGSGAIGAIAIVISVLLMLASGIGSFMAKGWSVVTLWISLILSLLASVVIGNSFPAYIAGDFVNWVIVLIVALYLTADLKRS